MSDLTQNQLREILDYDSATGIFTWKKTHKGMREGKEAGCVNKSLGYRAISIRGIVFYAHRLAVLWMTGAWPEEDVDHVNGLKADNRWENLRVAAHSENMQNVTGVNARNSSGLHGVSWRKDTRNWRAYIGLGMRYVHLGHYATKEEAHAAHLEAKARLHTFQPTFRKVVDR